MKHQIAVSLVVVVLTLLAATATGSVSVDFSQLFVPDSTSHNLFFQLRLPRVLFAALIGAALAVSGAVFQGMFRNPLATPYTLGVAAGAAFGATIGLTLGLQLLPPVLWSILGAAGATLLLLSLFRTTFHLRTTSILLAGVAISYFFSSLILFIQYISDAHGTFRVVRWLMGSLQVVGYDYLLWLIPVFGVSFALMLSRHRELDLLLVDDEYAATRGVDCRRVYCQLLVATSILVGVAVAISGPIGFVGLMVPHVCRMLFGERHQTLLIFSALWGAAFLVSCDMIARIVIAPAEIPVGVLTALLGGPFFFWLLVRELKQG